jgi:type II secretory pathway pseudopilin PulG
MTLVELLVAMAVTSILLVGLGNVLINVSSRYLDWANRLNTASTGTALASSLQADGHRYVLCTGYGGQGQVLDLCYANDRQSQDAVVRYTITTQQPFIVSRQQPAGSPGAFLARSLSTDQPYFWADCIDTGNTASGHIHVYHLRLDDGAGGTGGGADSENFSVYYVAPRTAC